MRPIQLVREDDACAGALARDVPVYEPGPCEGCPHTKLCEERGEAKVFAVREVQGQPLYCQKIDANLVPCRADHIPSLEQEAKPQPVRAGSSQPLYLADASVFINAERWQWAQCQLVIEKAGSAYALATTDLVRDELHHAYRLPAELEIVEVDPDDLHPQLVAAAEANRDPATGKRASQADLSLIQAAIDDERFAGILSEDRDHAGLHPPSLVEQIAGHTIEALDCDAFCRRRPNLFATYEG